MLSIALVSALLHGKYGGPSEVLRLHAEGLRKRSILKVYGVCDPKDLPSINGYFESLLTFEPGFPKSWFVGKGMFKGLSDISQGIDVYHAHMIWDYPVYAAWKVASAQRRPLIITPHGSLNGRWRYSGLKKYIYRKFILDNIFHETSFVHVLNKNEELACREFGIKSEIRIIPNGIPLNKLDCEYSPYMAFEKWPRLKDKRVVLYLGRLWSGKGLDVLVESWAFNKNKVNLGNWLLVIAGPDYRNYKSHLEQKIESMGLEQSIYLLDPVYDDLKNSLIKAATLFVLPSHAEGFSMAILEALAEKIPVLYTDKCNFPELAANQGGWEISDTSKAFSDAFDFLLAKDDSFFLQVGKLGWVFLRESYSLEGVIDKLIDMYTTANENY
jgi:glycosyltransferase involved in cell wall biosynthesis